jgi:hypothetical protein
LIVWPRACTFAHRSIMSSSMTSAGGAATNVRRMPVLAVALIVRLFAAWVTFGSSDLVASFRNTLRVFHGQLAVTPYLPFIELWMWIAGALVQWTPIAAPFAYKLLPSICDALVVLLLIDGDRGSRLSSRAAWLYALAPIPVFINAIHGQWDGIWIYCLLLAVLLARDESVPASVSAGVFFAISVIVKPIAVPLVFIVMPLRRRNAVGFFCGSLASGVLYAGIAAAVRMLPTIDQLSGIVHYGAGGIQLFGLPSHPVPRLWSTLLVAAGLTALTRLRRVTAGDAILLFFCSVLGFSGLAPQYLCWLIPFGLYAGRTKFMAAYGLITGVFLALYYEVPVLNRINFENLGAYGLHVPLGRFSPVTPPAVIGTIAQVLGNFLIPLLATSYFLFHIVKQSTKKPRPATTSAPTDMARLIAPALLVAGFVTLLALWAAMRPAIDDKAFIARIDQKVKSYDVQRFRSPLTQGEKIWIARSFLEPAAGSPITNVANLAIVWSLAWSLAAFYEPKH